MFVVVHGGLFTKNGFVITGPFEELSDALEYGRHAECELMGYKDWTIQQLIEPKLIEKENL